MLVHSFPLLYFCLVQKGIAIENGTTLQMGTRLNPISDVYFNHLWSSNEIRMTEKMVKWKEFVFHSFEYFPFSAMWNSTFSLKGLKRVERVWEATFYYQVKNGVQKMGSFLPDSDIHV